MTDPRPLLHDALDEPEWLLLRATDLDVPPEQGKQRLLMALGVGAGSAVMGTTSAAAAKTGAGLAGSAPHLFIAKWVALGVLGGVVAAGTTDPSRRGYTAEDDRTPKTATRAALDATNRAVPQRLVEESHPVNTAPVSSSTGMVARPPGASRTDLAPRTHAPVARALPTDSPAVRIAGPVNPPSPEGSLAEEIALVDAARAALASGDAARCFSMTETHGDRFRAPRLGPEVRLLRIEALLALGNREEARRLGQEFVTSHPESTHVQRVRRLLGSDLELP